MLNLWGIKFKDRPLIIFAAVETRRNWLILTERRLTFEIALY